MSEDTIPFISAKTINRIGAVQNKADKTDNPHEAAAFHRKAAQMRVNSGLVVKPMEDTSDQRQRGSGVPRRAERRSDDNDPVKHARVRRLPTATNPVRRNGG